MEFYVYDSYFISRVVWLSSGINFEDGHDIGRIPLARFHDKNTIFGEKAMERKSFAE